MATDGGGWTLVLNYNHKANTDPATNIRGNSLPLLGSLALGTDESGSQYWGHASNNFLNQLSFSELRFYGKTSSHSRVINFKTTHTGTINYFKTGLGSASGLQSSFTPLTGHSSFLPLSAIDYITNAGEDAALKYPFFSACNYHWAIRGDAATVHRWEVDDILCTGCCSVVQGNTKDTYHQIWIR